MKNCNLFVFHEDNKQKLTTITQLVVNNLNLLQQKLKEKIFPLLDKNKYILHPDQFPDILSNEAHTFLLFLQNRDVDVSSLRGKKDAIIGLDEKIVLSLSEVFQDFFTTLFVKDEYELLCFSFFVIDSYMKSYLQSFFEELILKRNKEQEELYTLNDTILKKQQQISEKERQFQNEKIKAPEEKEQSKTDFLINLSNKIKLPLTALGNSIHEARAEAGNRRLPVLEKVEMGIEQADTIINNMLDYEKIKQGEMIYTHKDVVNISAIVQAKAKMFNRDCGVDTITLTTDIQENLYTKIDSHALDRILNTILDNAVKYNIEPGTIHIVIMEHEKRILLQVRDSGIGIPEDQLPHIFKPNDQSETRKKNNPGLGLGLLIVKNILKEVKGDITITSEQGKGTSVTLTFQKKKINEKDEIKKDPFVSPPVTPEKIRLQRHLYGIETTSEKQARDQTLLFACLLHEFKTPLSIIQNTLNTVFKTRNIKKIPGIDDTEMLINRMLRDIESILEVETLIREKHTYSHTTIVNMTEAVSKEIDAFTILARKKKIALKSYFDKILYCKIDHGALGRILHNILDNAIKYTPHKGEIRVSLTSVHNRIKLTIKDTGKGIGKRDIKQIFEPYYRGKQDEQDTPGMGLGLFLVKFVANSAGGTVKAASTINKGTTIVVQLPLYHPGKDETIVNFRTDSPVIQKDISFPEQIYRENKFTLLIVDDDKEFLMYMHNNLINKYNIYLAEDGKKALEKLPSIPKPDIIISDIIMEGMDGHKFFNNITVNPGYCDIPFIFLTGNKDREEKVRSLQAGVIDYIYKPFSMDEVMAKIESIVMNRQKTTEMNRKMFENKLKSVMQDDSKEELYTFTDKCMQYNISYREREVLQLVLEGKQMKEIAGRFSLSVHTIRNHVQRIYKKCGVKDRVGLINVFRGRMDRWNIG